MTPGSLEPKGSQGQRPLIAIQFPGEEYALESPGDLTKLPTSMVEDESGAQYSAFQWVSSRVIQGLSNQSGWKEQGLMALPEESCTACFFLFVFSPGTAVFICIEILHSSSLKICSLAFKEGEEKKESRSTMKIWKQRTLRKCGLHLLTNSSALCRRALLWAWYNVPAVYSVSPGLLSDTAWCKAWGNKAKLVV